jgi:hypothetical protein
MSGRAPPPPFFVVWREDGGAPVYKHTEQWKAEQEAKRLSREHPGQRFCVLVPAVRIVTSNTVIERFDTSDDVPF